MLTELAVANLGVIEQLNLVLGPGMTVLTGETGAGKTLVVTAVELLLGGRADPALVRSGAAEAVVEGRFLQRGEGGEQGEEVVLRRVVPAEGRARAYLDGQLASAATLEERGRELVDLHGQHSQQSLLRRAHQRALLDRFGRVDLAPLMQARAALAGLERRRVELGGDERSRAREIELCRYQLAELDAAGLDDPGEEESLRFEEAVLSDAAAGRDAARQASLALGSDGPVGAELARINASLENRPFLEGPHGRILNLAEEVADLAVELRRAAESINEDPVRLAEVRQRRELLVDLRRKYGDTLAEVMEFHRDLAARLEELEDFDRLARDLDGEHGRCVAAVADTGAVVGAARRHAAPALGREVTAHMRELAMNRAEVRVVVGEDPGDEVDILLAANSGAPSLPLTSAASGGELARIMLALRLVTSAGPPVLVFDEVDAGIGGQVAQTVGRALSRLTPEHQVLVVTHLPQVAACADHQVSISKHDDGFSVTVVAETLEGEDRIVELSRMLSGSPASQSARLHALELLEASKR
ncbi:DNA repair protein RecN [Candidatus Poriferisocius sp.]|uniref:DNA repair protein RecN n=1 Tax=Candidatus Poriferisocius sp. TaxID=3101276 RepID=UPI003B0258C6